MAETPPVDATPTLTYDGQNHDQVLDLLREMTPLNPILRGGVTLEPAPGQPVTIEIEYADGSSLTLTEGDVISVDGTVAIGVRGGVVTPPLTEADLLP